MQIFSVQFSDGVALVNHIDCYDDTTGIFELSDGDIVTIEPQEPPVRLWTKCSREFGIPDNEHYYAGHHHDKAGSHVSPRNHGRKPTACK